MYVPEPIKHRLEGNDVSLRYGGDGSVYEGSFRYGRSSGQAVMTYPSGDTAVGEFLDMKPHGRVVFEAADTPGPDGDDSPNTDSKLLVMRGNSCCILSAVKQNFAFTLTLECN